jgi:hypothetical protein
MVIKITQFKNGLDRGGDRMIQNVTVVRNSTLPWILVAPEN